MPRILPQTLSLTLSLTLPSTLPFNEQNCENVRRTIDAVTNIYFLLANIYFTIFIFIFQRLLFLKKILKYFLHYITDCKIRKNLSFFLHFFVYLSLFNQNFDWTKICSLIVTKRF